MYDTGKYCTISRAYLRRILRKVKGRDVETYDTLNDVLVNLFRDINDIEEKAITSYENKDDIAKIMAQILFDNENKKEDKK